MWQHSIVHIISVLAASFLLMVSVGCAAEEEVRAVVDAEQAAEVLEDEETDMEHIEEAGAGEIPSSPLIHWQIAVCLLVCTGLCFWGSSYVRHRKQQRIILAQEQQLLAQQETLTAQEEALTAQRQQHEAQLQQMTEQVTEQAQISARLLGDFLGEVNRLAAHYPQPPREWNTYATMKHDVAQPFAEFIGKLEQTGVLSEREITYCVYSILYREKTQAELAAYIYYAPSGIRTFKLRVAKKLGTTATALYDHLLRLALGKE